MRISVIFILLIISLLESSFAGDQIELDTEGQHYEKYSTEEERDTHIITNAVKTLLRPDFDKYPYLILVSQGKKEKKSPASALSINSSTNNQSGTILKLVIPKPAFSGDSLDGSTFITIKTSFIDLTKDLIIFPLGTNGIGFTMKQVYIVLRRSTLNHSAHYINLAYVRQQRKQFSVEWSMVDPVLFGKNRIDDELCRGEICDIYHFVFGTCRIASNKCQQQKPLVPEGVKDKSVLFKWTWKTNMENGTSSPVPSPTAVIATTTELQNNPLPPNDLTIQPISPPPTPTPAVDQRQPSPSANDVQNANGMVPSNDQIQPTSPLTPANQPQQPINNVSPTSNDAQQQVPNNANGMVTSNDIQIHPALPSTDDKTSNSNNAQQPMKINLDDSMIQSIPGRRMPRNSNSKRITPSNSRQKRESEEEEDEIGHANAAAVPNSIDLLLLKRSNDKETGLTDAHFQNSLTGTRQVQQQQQEMMINNIECIGCEKIGEFFDDFAEEPEFSILVGNATERLEKNSNPLAGGDDILINHPDIPYIAFGYCNFSQERAQHTNRSKEVDDLMALLLNSLRLECDQPSQNRIRAIFTSKLKLLEIQEDFSVAVSHLSPLLKYKILTTFEFKTLMTALVVSKCIQIYRDEVSKLLINKATSVNSSLLPPEKNNLVVDKNISRGIQFLTKVVLSLTDSLTKKFSQHLIKGLRFILRLLKDKFISLLQDRNEKKDAQLDSLSDLYQVMALKEFIIYGLGPIAKSGSTTEASFQSFYTQNVQRIQELVEAYGIIKSIIKK